MFRFAASAARARNSSRFSGVRAAPELGMIHSTNRLGDRILQEVAE
jgi:hypothetical protein